MRTALLAAVLFLLGAAGTSLGADLHPHSYFRRPLYCAHYDYRLAFDYPWHRTNWRPTAYIGLPAMGPQGVSTLPPPSPPLLGPPLGMRRADALNRARLLGSSQLR